MDIWTKLPVDAPLFTVGAWRDDSVDIRGEPRMRGRVMDGDDGGRPPWDMSVMGPCGPVSFRRELYTLTDQKYPKEKPIVWISLKKRCVVYENVS